jgi:uncharacterized protein (DUF433 family)
VTTLEQVEQLFDQLNTEEKWILFRRMVDDLANRIPGIESDDRICGGEARIVRTRIPVWVLEQARRLGKTESEILLAYPMLRAEDLANAWGYVRSHPQEIERGIRENEEA